VTEAEADIRAWQLWRWRPMAERVPRRVYWFRRGAAGEARDDHRNQQQSLRG